MYVAKNKERTHSFHFVYEWGQLKGNQYKLSTLLKGNEITLQNKKDFPFMFILFPFGQQKQQYRTGNEWKRFPANNDHPLLLLPLLLLFIIIFVNFVYGHVLICRFSFFLHFLGWGFIFCCGFSQWLTTMKKLVHFNVCVCVMYVWGCLCGPFEIMSRD